MKKYNIILAILSAFAVFALTFGGNQLIKGAATADISSPIFEIDMNSGPSSGQEEILYKKGVYTILTNREEGNKAWKFDGQTHYAITSSAHLKDLEEFTIMFWFKPSSRSLSKRAHMMWQGELDEAGESQSAGNGWGKEQELHISLGNEIKISTYEESSVSFYFGDEENNLKISTPIKYVDWQHVAAVVKNSEKGSSVNFYLDSSLVGTKTINQKIKQNKWEEATLYLGRARKDGPAGDTNRLFEGALNELKIFDKALSSDEIFKLCRRQNEGKICGN